MIDKRFGKTVRLPLAGSVALRPAPCQQHLLLRNGVDSNAVFMPSHGWQVMLVVRVEMDVYPVARGHVATDAVAPHGSRQAVLLAAISGLVALQAGAPDHVRVGGPMRVMASHARQRIALLEAFAVAQILCLV